MERTIEEYGILRIILEIALPYLRISFIEEGFDGFRV
jgi:hypothetical protein